MYKPSLQITTEKNACVYNMPKIAPSCFAMNPRQVHVCLTNNSSPEKSAFCKVHSTHGFGLRLLNDSFIMIKEDLRKLTKNNVF